MYFPHFLPVPTSLSLPCCFHLPDAALGQLPLPWRFPLRPPVPTGMAAESPAGTPGRSQAVPLSPSLSIDGVPPQWLLLSIFLRPSPGCSQSPEAGLRMGVPKLQGAEFPKFPFSALRPGIPAPELLTSPAPGIKLPGARRAPKGAGGAWGCGCGPCPPHP